MANCGDLQYASGDVCIGGNLVVAGTVTAAGGGGSAITAVNATGTGLTGTTAGSVVSLVFSGVSDVSSTTGAITATKDSATNAVSLTYNGGSSSVTAITVIDSSSADGIICVSPTTLPVLDIDPAAYCFAMVLNTPTKPTTTIPATALKVSTPYLITGSMSVRMSYTTSPDSVGTTPTFDFFMAPYTVPYQLFTPGGSPPTESYTTQWAHVKSVNASEALNSFITSSTVEFTFPISCIMTTPATPYVPPSGTPSPMQLCLGIAVYGFQEPTLPQAVNIAYISCQTQAIYRAVNLSMVELGVPAP